MLDEVAPEILWIAGAGCIVVCGLMVMVWLVAIRENSGKKEEEKESDSSAKNKKRRQHVSPRKKKEPTARVEETPAEVAETVPSKSILKEGKGENASPRPQHVEFQKEVPKESKPTPRTNPPTPYPQSAPRTPQAKDIEEPKSKPTGKEEKKQTQQSQVLSKAADSKPAVPQKAKQSKPTESASQQPVEQKKKGKTKQPAAASEGM